jgi:hypothetical protein
MRSRHRSRFLSALLVAALGCASGGPQTGGCPASAGQVLADPALLREHADAALREDDPELAYRYLALLQTLHPDSAESRELYPAAAKLFKQAYFRNRISKPSSVWLTSEPAFMFQWLASFFRGAQEFPQEQVDLLFVGMPLPVFQEFESFARSRPAVFDRWQLRAAEDDGKIEAVTGTRVEGSGRRAGASGG